MKDVLEKEELMRSWKSFRERLKSMIQWLRRDKKIENGALLDGLKEIF